jgi:hypothetical protein
MIILKTLENHLGIPRLVYGDIGWKNTELFAIFKMMK